MHNYPMKYESFRANNLRGVAFTKWSGMDEATNAQTEKLYTPILSYARKKNSIKILNYTVV